MNSRGGRKIKITSRHKSKIFQIGLALLLILIFQSEFQAQETPNTPNATDKDTKSAAAPIEKNVNKNVVQPPYKNLRYDEDYGYLRDENRRAELLDRLKFIPLNRSESWYLSVGGEMRLRYETYRNAAFGAGIQDGDGYFLQRYMLHGDFHFGSKLRFFGQLKSGIATGRNGGPRPFDEDKLDVNQAFADIEIYKSEKSSVTIRAGRQEVEFGSSRLISAQEGLTVRQSFDGLRVIYQRGKWQFSPSFIKPVRNRFGYFDDRTDAGKTFIGGYVARPLPKKYNGIAIAYYDFYDSKTSRFDQGAGREKRHLAGARIAGKTGAFDFNYELIGQWGDFAASKIRAWAVATDSGYVFPKTFWQPRFALRADATSGDRDPFDNKLGTFNAIFNAGIAYSGLVGSIGASNSMSLVPSFNLTPTKKLRVSGDWSFFWRTSTRDAVYGLAGGVLRTGRLSDARYVGSQNSLRMDYQFDRHWSATSSYAHFFVGEFLRETPPAKNLDYLTTYLSFKF